MGSRNLSSSAVISDGFCSMTSAVLGLKSRQKASRTFCQAARPPLTSSSSSSSPARSEEHTSELQSLMRISYAVFCLHKKNANTLQPQPIEQNGAHARSVTQVQMTLRKDPHQHPIPVQNTQ